MKLSCIFVYKVDGFDLDCVITCNDSNEIKRCMSIQYAQTHDNNAKVTSLMSPADLLGKQTGIVCEMQLKSTNDKIDFLYSNTGWFLFLFLLVNNKIHEWKKNLQPYCSNFPVKIIMLFT